MPSLPCCTPFRGGLGSGSIIYAALQWHRKRQSEDVEPFVLVAAARPRRLRLSQAPPRLGPLAPPPDDVARGIAGRDRVRVRLQPAGAYAANALGLTAKVPAHEGSYEWDSTRCHDRQHDRPPYSLRRARSISDVVPVVCAATTVDMASVANDTRGLAGHDKTQ